jgi:hypothetical protein
VRLWTIFIWLRIWTIGQGFKTKIRTNKVNVIRRMRWLGHVAPLGEMRNAYKILIGYLEGKRPLGRHRHRWEDHIKMTVKEIGVRLWTGFVSLRIWTIGRPCEHGNESFGSKKCGEFLD